MAQIIVPYLLFGGLWILLSDRLLAKIEPDPALRIEWSIYKGWAYVLVTGILLTLLLSRVLRARERAAAALDETDRRFSLVFRKSPIAIAITRLADGRFLDINDSFVRTTGWSREKAVGRTSTELYLWHDPGQREEIAERVRAEGRVPPVEIAIRRRSGAVVPMLYSVERIELAGEPCLIGMAQDITARKSMEEELRARLQRFLTASPAVLYVLRIEGDRVRQVWISDNLERITGWTPAESRDPGWWYSQVHPEDKERVLEGRARVRDRFGKSKLLEYRFRHKSGAWIWIRDEQRYQPAEEGEWIEAVGTWIDISEQKRLEANVLQMQKIETVGMLAGGIAHDFNNLLSVIRGYTELGLEEARGDEAQRKNLEEILRASRQAAALTSQLLAFSRKQILQPEILDINDVLRETSKMLERLIGENIELHLLPHPELAQVSADRGQVQQIIMNLAVNARDAMPDGGKLVVETGHAVFDEEYVRGHFPALPGKYVMLAVSDSGAGMDAATQARIFEPFFTTKEKGKGTGLGLSTVYGIVKQSNGFVWVYSERGRGTTFKVYLPRVEGRRETPIPETGPAEGLGGTEAILVVEDEAPLRELACRILQRKGYSVIPAANGEEALERAASCAGKIDMLVTDMLMPRMGGKELASRMKARFPGIRVLYISGYTDHSIVHRGILDEGVAFLQKPFSMESLARKVRAILDGNA